MYASNTIHTVTNFNATNTANTVEYSNAAGIAIRPVNYYHLTYSGAGTGTLTTASIAGNLTVSSGTFTSSGTITFNGSATQSINGTGTIVFTNLTMNTASAANLLINRSMSVNSVLDFAANGLLVVNASSDVTIGQNGTVTNFNASRYIQLDGGTGSNGQLIKATTAAIAGATSWEIIYPIGTATGGYTPMDFTTGVSDVAGANPTAGATLAVKAIYNNSIRRPVAEDI